MKHQFKALDEFMEVVKTTFNKLLNQNTTEETHHHEGHSHEHGEHHHHDCNCSHEYEHHHDDHHHSHEHGEHHHHDHCGHCSGHHHHEISWQRWGLAIGMFVIALILERSVGWIANALFLLTIACIGKEVIT